MSAERRAMNAEIIDKFRANSGVVGGPFDGTPLLLLTTTGARSGELRTMPLTYLRDGDDRLVVFATLAVMPRLGDFQARAGDRVIPVVVLVRSARPR